MSNKQLLITNYSLLVILSHQEREAVNILQGNAGSLGYRVQRVFGNVEGDVDLTLQTTVQAAQQGTATSQPDTILHDVGIQFGGRILQGGEYGILYLGYRFVYS